jgi:membrane associated rhomboid family serine protease
LIPIGDDRRLPIFPYVVYLLIALNVYVFVQEVRAADIDGFIGLFATIPYDITHSIVLPAPSPPLPALTILTAMFLHASVLHIAFNMLFLFVFGPVIEFACGHARFAALYLLCGIAGGIAQIAIAPGSHVPELGASGAIAGVLGAYIVSYPAARINTIVPIGCFPLFLRLPAVLVIGVWAAIQFVNGFGSLSARLATASEGTAYFAHIGGFSLGVLAIGLFRRRDTGTRGSRGY